jgi:ComF family protein
MPWLTQAHCPVCALPTPDAAICGHCLREPPTYKCAQALFNYAFPIDQLIQQLKYQEKLAIAPLFGKLLAEHWQGELPDLWLPMPLHSRRLKERGFNQAVEMTRELSRLTGVSMHHNLALRIRDTPPQAGLKREARRKNLRGAFACQSNIADLHIGVVDDVMTTGSTLDALTTTLKQAGAREVSCLVVARA